MDTTIAEPPVQPGVDSEYDDLSILNGEAAIFHLLDGSKTIGLFESMDTKTGAILVANRDSNTPEKISLKNIRVIQYSRQFHQATDNPVDSNKKKFNLKFIDNIKLQGTAVGFIVCQHGLLLLQSEGINQYRYIFAPFDALMNCKMDEETVYSNAKHDHTQEEASSSESEVQQPVDEVTSSIELEYALKHQNSQPNLRLGEVLINDELITEQQLEEILEFQKQDSSGMPLGELLVEKGILTQEAVQTALAKKLGIPFVNLRKYEISPKVINLIPKKLIKRYRVIPLAIYNGKLVIALENPINLKTSAIDALSFHTNMLVESVMSTATDIDWATNYYYDTQGLGSEFNDALTEDLVLDDGDDDSLEDSEIESDLEDNIVVKLMNKIVIDAYQQGASDIHIEPYPGNKKTIIRFRRDGTLTSYLELPAQYRQALISRLKIMSNLDISERRKPQDGKINFKKYGPLDIELRVATLPTAGGVEDVVLRILAKGGAVAVDKLGLSKQNKERVIANIEKPYGMFLVCGPTGSGKTTTLHALLAHLNTVERKIWTAEDPVEITQKGLRQVQVQPKINFTFAAAMRAFLRADPDIIMVGEMRDKETAGTGIEASLTGHLLFSTLHTNSAPESIIRLLDMGMDPFNFSDALLGIIAQRLAKTLCSHCKEEYICSDHELMGLAHEYCEELITEETDAEKMYAEALNEWHETYANDDNKITLCKPVGCEKCNNTGYSGRLALHEFLEASDDIKRLILERSRVQTILQAALASGMRTLKQDGIEKVMQGFTDMLQIRAVCIK